MTDEEKKARKREDQRRWKKNNPDKVKAMNARWKASNLEKAKRQDVVRSQRWQAKNKLRAMWNNIGSSANKRGLTRTISFEEMQALVEPMRCAATGMPLSWDDPDWFPSPDRIENTVGYEPGNVRIVSWAYNRAKHASTDERVLQMARALVGIYGMEVASDE